MQKKTAGFSLIELMIVVAIISILASLSIPAYETYTQRARFTEVILATSAFKTAISLALQEGIPANELFNQTHGIPPSPSENDNLASILVEKGVIKATAGKLLNRLTYILKPDALGSRWSISGTCIKAGLCHAS